MKAFLLAAGVAAREGRSPTRPRSACWPSAGSHCSTSGWTRSTARASSRLVNLHHLPDVVPNHLKARARSLQPLAVRTVFEPELLGSAGTLAANLGAWVDGRTCPPCLLRRQPHRFRPAVPGRVAPGARRAGDVMVFHYVIVKQRFDNDIYVNYSKKEIVSRAEDLEHELVREAMWMTGVTNGVEITTLADIPSAGSGLGSSSAVTVGLLHALFAYRGRQVTAEELADRACTIEIDRCGKPIGKQDQYIAAYGGIRDIRFGPGDQVVAEELGAALPPGAGTLQRQHHAVLHGDHPERELDPGRADREHQSYPRSA